MFIDDLDRCSDEVIVQICEAVKLYLDGPGLIFVIACDLSVLARGVAVSARGGVGEGRAYLEKIIQVVYKIPPLEKAKIRKLILGYVQETGISELLDETVIGILVERAGRNPRRIKQIINSFVLEYQLNPAWRKPPLDSSLLIITVLIQHLYTSFYEFLINEQSGDDPIGIFLDYAAVRAKASAPPPSDHPWWTVVRRTFHEYGIPAPDRSLSTGAKLIQEIERLETVLPDGFPALARNSVFVALLRSIGDRETRASPACSTN